MQGITLIISMLLGLLILPKDFMLDPRHNDMGTSTVPESNIKL